MTPMRSLLLAACLALVSCGGGASSPTQPSQPTTYTLSGTVTSTQGGAISGASVRIADGPNASQSATTDGSGHYTLAALTQAGFTVNFSAANFTPTAKGVTLIGNTTLDAQLEPIPLFAHSGVGDTVFDIPSTVTRVRIIADYGGFTSNFIVRIAGSLVVNELIGTGWGTTHFDGTYLIHGGTAQITNSSGVHWLFTEVR
jgi:hypothetical protein